jgi:hypothetical protein
MDWRFISRIYYMECNLIFVPNHDVERCPKSEYDYTPSHFTFIASSQIAANNPNRGGEASHRMVHGGQSVKYI